MCECVGLNGKTVLLVVIVASCALLFGFLSYFCRIIIILNLDFKRLI